MKQQPFFLTGSLYRLLANSYEALTPELTPHIAFLGNALNSFMATAPPLLHAEGTSPDTLTLSGTDDTTKNKEDEKHVDT